MFRLKQFTGLLLIVMLASLTFSASSTSLATMPSNCDWYIDEQFCGWCEECLDTDSGCLNLPVGYSLCADAILKKLGNVDKNETLLEFSIANIAMSYENVNPQCNAPPAEGTVFAADTYTVTHVITNQDVEKNGSAVITGLCFTYDFFQDLVRPNPQWNNCWVDVASFDVDFVLTQNGTDAHVIWAHCVPSGDCDPYEGVDWNCEKICDSQDPNLNFPPCTE